MKGAPATPETPPVFQQQALEVTDGHAADLSTRARETEGKTSARPAGLARQDLMGTPAGYNESRLLPGSAKSA